MPMGINLPPDSSHDNPASLKASPSRSLPRVGAPARTPVHFLSPHFHSPGPTSGTLVLRLDQPSRLPAISSVPKGTHISVLTVATSTVGCRIVWFAA